MPNDHVCLYAAVYNLERVKGTTVNLDTVRFELFFYLHICYQQVAPCITNQATLELMSKPLLSYA